jgi:hypothetical protein
MPQESSGTDWHRRKSHMRLFGDYDTIDHVLWGFERFDAERPQFWIKLRATDTEWGNILGGRDSRDLKGLMFFPKALQPKDIYN